MDVIGGNVVVVDQGNAAYLFKDSVLKYDHQSNQWTTLASVTMPFLVNVISHENPKFAS